MAFEGGIGDILYRDLNAVLDFLEAPTNAMCFKKNTCCNRPSIRVCLKSAFDLYAVFAFVFISQNCVVSSFSIPAFSLGAT